MVEFVWALCLSFIVLISWATSLAARRDGLQLDCVMRLALRSSARRIGTDRPPSALPKSTRTSHESAVAGSLGSMKMTMVPFRRLGSPTWLRSAFAISQTVYDSGGQDNARQRKAPTGSRGAVRRVQQGNSKTLVNSFCPCRQCWMQH